MKKEKVLIFAPNSGNWGGGEIYIEQLCHYMNQAGVESYILSSEPERFSCPAKRMDNVLSKKKRFLASMDIAKKYKKENFKVIVLNDLASLWLAPIFKVFGFRVISLLHLYLQRRYENPLGHSVAEYYLLKYSALFCDRIFSVNKNNQKVFGEKRVTFIGNFVPDWFFQSPQKEAKYDFILIARLAKQKNVPLFLELLKELNSRKKQEYTALIVGEGPERESIDKVIEAKGLSLCVTMMDWVSRDELPNVYDKGKCFVISSYHEGFATTLLEAHARGVPAIVTRSSGFCGEFVEGYGSKTGLVFTPEELEDAVFYDRIADLVEHSADYETACREKAKVFSKERVLGPVLKAVME